MTITIAATFHNIKHKKKKERIKKKKKLFDF